MSAREVLIKWWNPTGFHTEQSAADNVDAILSALGAAGFAVVPRRPTEEMELRGDEDRGSAAAVWFNMISAAAKETP